MSTAAIKTLGCKLNQYESEQMREQLQRLGYEIVDVQTPADLYVINSCTVTGRTDRDTRRLARRLKRRQPGAFVVVTGCYAQVAPGDLAAVPEIDLVLGNADKLRLAELVPPPENPSSISLAPAAYSTLIDEFAGHTRCFVKVQEGCNSHCSYCIIPAARGPSRSVPHSDVIAQVRKLAIHHPEIVLIGIHLGQYGNDLPPPTDLAGLVAELAALPEVQRLRLSSIEPCEMSAELADMVAAGGHALRTRSAPAPAGGKLCRHLHIPLQSGCDSVLRRMNRPYDVAYFASLVRHIHELQPATCLGTDIIVGFPGETEEEFAATVALVESLPLSYLHVFTYSPRHGTPAATMPDQVDYEVKIARNHVLRDLSEVKRADFARTMAGRELEVVLQTEEPDGSLLGLSDNYLQVRVQGSPDQLHDLVRCEITATSEATLRGRITR